MYRCGSATVSVSGANLQPGWTDRPDGPLSLSLYAGHRTFHSRTTPKPPQCSILFAVNARPLLINCRPNSPRQTNRQTDGRTNKQIEKTKNPTGELSASDILCIFINTDDSLGELQEVASRRHHASFRSQLSRENVSHAVGLITSHPVIRQRAHVY